MSKRKETRGKKPNVTAIQQVKLMRKERPRPSYRECGRRMGVILKRKNPIDVKTIYVWAKYPARRLVDKLALK